jgi:hypothetical protein
MILAIILVFTAAATLAVILKLAVSRSLPVGSGPGQRIHPIDVQAFRNLIDSAEDEYLRQHLSPPQLRTVRRARLRAMAAYVRLAAYNSTVLMRIGEEALASNNPHTLEAARELVNGALLLRRNTTLALARIYFSLAWPNHGFAAVRIADHYDRLGRSAMLLGRLQNPAQPLRISGS